MSTPDVLETDFNGLARATDSLPAAWYRCPEHFNRELREIWHRHWINIGHASVWPHPRDYRAIDIAGQSVVIVRTDDGTLRAWRNVCRHRGSELCPAGSGRLKSAFLVCPYHQWSYRLTGELASTGHARKVAGFAKAEHGLLPVALHVWRGFVYINLAGDAAPGFAPALGDELAPLASWPLEELVVGHSWKKTLDCNWKIFWENFNECLHCPAVHPGLCDLVPIYKRAIMVQKDDPDWAASADSSDPANQGGLRAGAESWTTDGQRHGPAFSGLSDAERQAGQTYAVTLPSGFIVGHSDYVRSVRVLPLGPDRMELAADWLFHPETLAQHGFDAAQVAAFAITVMREDGDICEVNQRGLRDAEFSHGTLMQEEYEVYAFQQWVRHALGAGADLKGAGIGPRASRRKA